MRRGRKLIHIQPDFRQQSPCGHSIDSRNGAQPSNLLFKRAHAPGDILLDLPQLPLGEQQMIVELPQQEAIVLAHAAFQGQPQLGHLIPQQSLRHLRQPRRILLPREHRFQHRSPRSTPSVRRYRGQLDVGFFRKFLNTVGDAVDLQRQTHPIPSEIPQFTRRPGRHKTSAQQSMLQQVRDPLAVLLVRPRAPV